MARFDDYRLSGQGEARFVLDVQADLLEALGTRVVVPLLPKESAPKSAQGLNPVFVADGRSRVMVTQFMASAPDRELKVHVSSLAVHQDAITQAIDLQL
ncbi:CcdB-like toxin protein [Acetobacter nitrogenifigens DSM 23921 = NBRC 105050]|uniref:Toxin CcdB n=1 Tax=Acetobacter nitrogenifigens DSM 23921 = NBRC 105050 TaxID=1120919 RepID=A0A511XFD7_9PROT|nr:CcdB family protein [Acetobacter nitrogenifigens]GBQ99375.1 CcdB-like toxin protein [Acetobacter nitrogenifigens DSM 23921 = NBRC 105050]GEN61667.1 plasmid maintenance protein CcdB [Acetobacter nitrogenifigens DSM 23921 = NBRC 105050]